MNDLCAIAIDELRTPLTLIVGPISMILESSDISAAARERLKVVEVTLNYPSVDYGFRASMQRKLLVH